jgi:hypothetical protein
MVHPSTPYIRPKKEGLRERLVSLELKPGGEIWDNVKLWVPLAIAVLKKDEQESFEMGGLRATKETQITAFGISPTIDSLKSKLSAGVTLKDKATRDSADGPYVVMLSGIAGNAQAQDMYFMLPQRAALTTHVTRQAGKWHNFSFVTELEAMNFLRFVTSKLAMAGCAINKINQHLENFELSAIPWLDFTKHWTDEDLYAHFKLTPDEIAWVEALPAHPRRSDPI